MFDEFDLYDPFEDEIMDNWRDYSYYENLELEHEEWLIRNQEEEEDN